jgi:hypothetical protein
MRREALVRPLLAGALALAALAAAPAGKSRPDPSLARTAAERPDARTTRADLEAARRRAAVLESELALAATRKPYLVLDLGGHALRYRLMGMTMREVAIPDLAVEGLETSEGAPGTPLLAGIFTLKEKENDPRLTPLSPEQVEDGADDENAANALPPEPPREYRLSFKQPIAVEVLGRETRGGMTGMWGRFVGALRRWHGPSGGDEEARLRIALHLDPDVAAEIYRSLIPEVRLLVLPPGGMVLPAAGQEAPPKPRPEKKAPPPVEKAAEPKEVPFLIPPPEDEQNRKAAEESGETAEPPPAAAPETGPAPEPPPPPPPGGGRHGHAAGAKTGSAGSGAILGLSGPPAPPT